MFLTLFLFQPVSVHHRTRRCHYDCVCVNLCVRVNVCFHVQQRGKGGGHGEVVVPCCIMGSFVRLSFAISLSLTLSVFCLFNWCPWTPCLQRWNLSESSQRWPPAPDLTRSATGTPTSAATSQLLGWSAGRLRLASLIASARPASQTLASLSLPLPVEMRDNV